MRIGIDCRIFGENFTGIGRYTYELVQNFIKQNEVLENPHELVLFLNDPEYKEFKSTSPWVKKILVNAKHYSLAEQTRFLRKLNKEKLDLVHFPHFNIPIFYNRPYIVTIHDLILTFFPGKKMTKFYHRWAYHLTIKNAVKKASKIIAVSRNTKKDIVDQLNIPADKIQVIYNGISDKFVLLSDPKPSFKTLKKYQITKQFLLYTGVWRSHKNLPNLIRAFDILLKKKRLDLQLVITGKKDPFYPEIPLTIKKHKLTNHVILTGLVDEKELNHLYNAALIYVFPSLYEGFGFPPLESMKCGTPVVASNRSSVPEVCGKDNAIFFNPEKPEDIAEKIYRVYKDADLQVRLIEKGVMHSSKFTWGKTSEQTFQLISDILKTL